jgi:hypothetical protein
VKLSPHLIPLSTSLRIRSLERAPHAPAQAKPSEASPGRLSAYHRDTFERTSATRRDLPALSVPPARLAKPSGDAPVNEAAEAQAKQQWRGDDDAVAQTTETDCGEASLTALNKAKGSAGPASVDAKRDEVRASEASARRAMQDRFDVNLVDGARPEEIGATLGSMGVAVTRGLTNYDPTAISEALKAGQFGMAMVDSQTLANAALPPEQRKEGTGALHWVTIDGYNHGELAHDTMDDKFRVKDPVNGTYWVGAKDLLKAMDVARIQHKNNGGMLLLENRPDVTTDAQREALARSNAEQTESLGKGNGIGSKRLSASESS